MKRRSFVLGALAVPAVARAQADDYPPTPTGGVAVSTWEDLDAAARNGAPAIDASGLIAPQGAAWKGRGWTNTSIVGGVFNELELTQLRNVRFFDTKVRYDPTGRPRKQTVLRIAESEEVRLYRPVLRDTGMVPRSVHGQGYAAWFQNNRDVGIYGHQIQGFALQIAITYSANFEAVGGRMWHSSRDGFNISNSTGVKLHRNYLHDFHVKQPEHPDFIQVLGHRSPVVDLELVGNVLNLGAGSAGQCMLLQNENLSKIGHHRNWLIEGNHIRGGHRHGLRCLGIDGLAIQRNHVEAGTIDFTEPYNRDFYLRLGHIEGNDDASVVPTLQIYGNCRNVVATGNVFSGKERVQSTAWNGPRLEVPSPIPRDWILRP